MSAAITNFHQIRTRDDIIEFQSTGFGHTGSICADCRYKNHLEFTCVNILESYLIYQKTYLQVSDERDTLKIRLEKLEQGWWRNLTEPQSKLLIRVVMVIAAIMSAGITILYNLW